MSALPVHCLANPGDKLTLCGIKLGDQDGRPSVWVKAAQRHIDGHHPPMCPDCWSTNAEVEQ